MHTIQSSYCGWNTVVSSKLEEFATADSLTANLPIVYRFSYLLRTYYFQVIVYNVVQSCPPCIQCSTSEQAVFRPTLATTRSSSPSSQPLLACAVTHIDLSHVIHCLWPLLWRFLSLLHVLIIYVTINLVNWKLVTSRLLKPCRQGCGNLVQPWNFCMARVCKGLHQQIQVKNISSVATVAILQIS